MQIKKQFILLVYSDCFFTSCCYILKLKNITKYFINYLKERFMKKVLSFIATITVIASFSSVDSFAAGNAGVGFGAELFKGKSGKFFELLAVTTNGTSCSQTFAITSGTSGYKEGAVIAMNDTEIFIAKNMDNLATDIARGEGEYVNIGSSPFSTIIIFPFLISSIKVSISFDISSVLFLFAWL